MQIGAIRQAIIMNNISFDHLPDRRHEIPLMPRRPRSAQRQVLRARVARPIRHAILCRSGRMTYILSEVSAREDRA